MTHKFNNEQNKNILRELLLQLNDDIPRIVSIFFSVTVTRFPDCIETDPGEEQLNVNNNRAQLLLPGRVTTAASRARTHSRIVERTTDH